MRVEQALKQLDDEDFLETFTDDKGKLLTEASRVYSSLPGSSAAESVDRLRMFYEVLEKRPDLIRTAVYMLGSRIFDAFEDL